MEGRWGRVAKEVRKERESNSKAGMCKGLYSKAEEIRTAVVGRKDMGICEIIVYEVQ